MNLLVIGGGGREHAIVRKLKENPEVETIYCLPGNGGIAADAMCVADIGAKDIPAQVAFAKSHDIDFAVVAPDDPLVLGAVDALEAAGIPCFGPEAKAAIIEGSKVFSKNLMKKYGIPTAEYQVFTDAGAAMDYVKTCLLPVVVKADGLALGKGVLIAEDRAAAVAAVETIMLDRAFGNSGSQVVIEEFLTGPEVSVLAFTDGETVVPMVSSMDHKRAHDHDEGLNTGGMGTVAPNPYYTEDIARTCMDTIFLPTMRAMNAEGCTFRGCLYFGLMLTPNGPNVIEYNCRFGDPETQVVLPLLKSDLLTIMQACRNGTLAETEVKFSDGAACCVIMASDGYPEHYEKGFAITMPAETAAHTYVAGAKLTDGKLLMFKNETHNHPTEIEPFGGAATCIGGCIRDPLSGRAYVHQAMRVTGAGDPRVALDKTLPGKLCQTAAAGYSSYGNQIGLATGHVAGLYHEGYIAKRLECGAVVAAAPAYNVRRECPAPGDVVILLGGRTGRDGIGGATGSSTSHNLKSLATMASEVQKGNAPEARKIQRLFRNGDVTRIIKRCNDFGAGGISVAIGELADGLRIDLDAVRKKYDGLDGTELAVSESQERMAVENGLSEAVMNMSFGNEIGFSAENTAVDWNALYPGAIVAELTENTADAVRLGVTTAEPIVRIGADSAAISELLVRNEGVLESVYPSRSAANTTQVPVLSAPAAARVAPKIGVAVPKVLIPVFPGTNCEYDSARAVRRAGLEPEILVLNNQSAQDVADSISRFAGAARSSQIIFVPGGFSGGDEPDGSAKFITAFFRNPEIRDATMDLLKNRDGLMLGICNGFQALIKLGLVPYGEIIDTDASCPTLTFNTIGRHQSRLVRTRTASNRSPWLAGTQVGDVYTVPISHGEGRFLCSEALVRKLADNGQIITQYVDANGVPGMDVDVNPNGSIWAIEGITSPDGRVLGKMGHAERIGDSLYQNVDGCYDMKLFQSAKKYFDI